MSMTNLVNVLPNATTGQAERIIRGLLERADVQVGGTRPWDIQVHNPAFYKRALRDGRRGVGESYMDGEWESPALDQFIAHVLLARLDKIVVDWRTTLYAGASKILNFQNAKRVFRSGQHHYDIGNDLYEAMLGETMSYTCAYWKNAKTLDEAQRAKLDLVCRKVGLEPGMRVLELGCGWGTFAKYAAENYGVEVTGYTVSKEQIALGNVLCKGLPVTLHLEDYRKARGAYDRVISIGLMEHVGYKNHRAYFETVDRCLKSDGVAFVHTIGNNISDVLIDSFYHEYLFPNALVPSLAQISEAMENWFVPEDVHNIGPDYDPTLMAWHANFEAAWSKLSGRYDERFHRLWRFYLLSCAGSFRSRFTQLYQVVLTREGRPQPACRLS